MDRRRFLRDIVLIVSVFLLSYSFGVAFGQTNPPASAKATAAVNQLFVTKLDANGTTDWDPILTKQIKTANQKDLFISPSLECGSYTRTKVSSAELALVEADARVQIRVRVVIDPGTANQQYAYPDRGLTFDADFSDPGEPTFGSAGDGVTYCARLQKLSAKFAGLWSAGCFDADPLTACTITPEELELIQQTLEASTFNFIAPNLSSGIHTVRVEARIDVGSNGDANAVGVIGSGSVTVEEVRMVKRENIFDF